MSGFRQFFAPMNNVVVAQRPLISIKADREKGAIGRRSGIDKGARETAPERKLQHCRGVKLLVCRAPIHRYVIFRLLKRAPSPIRIYEPMNRFAASVALLTMRRLSTDRRRHLSVARSHPPPRLPR